MPRLHAAESSYLAVGKYYELGSIPKAILVASIKNGSMATLTKKVKKAKIELKDSLL